MDSASIRDVRVQFEALLIAPIVQPLAGPVGEFEADLFAREIAVRLERGR